MASIVGLLKSRSFPSKVRTSVLIYVSTIIIDPLTGEELEMPPQILP